MIASRNGNILFWKWKYFEFYIATFLVGNKSHRKDYK